MPRGLNDKVLGTLTKPQFVCYGVSKMAFINGIRRAQETMGIRVDTYYWLRERIAETGNELDVQMAKANPGMIVFKRETKIDYVYEFAVFDLQGKKVK